MKVFVLKQRNVCITKFETYVIIIFEIKESNCFMYVIPLTLPENRLSELKECLDIGFVENLAVHL